MMMKKISILIILALLMGACSSVMFTGRKQVKLISDAEVTTMALQNYSQFISENELSSDVDDQALLNTVGAKIKKAVEQYLRQEGFEAEIADLQWEFHVVKSEEVNAWAMPGGKIVFYSGIMPICKDESGVAVVMGHEIGHVLAKHGNERMSQQMIAQLGSVALSEYLVSKPERTQYLYNTAFAVGTQYGALLPYKSFTRA